MRVLVVSDICFYREGIARALRDDGIDAVVLDPSTPELAAQARSAAAVLVDLADDSLGQILAEIGESAPVVGLAMTSSPPVAAAAALGVRAFVGRDQTLVTLVRTTRRAARGEAVCPPSIAASLFSSLRSTDPPPAPATVESLTRREQEIARLVMRGLSNKEIATTLVIGPATVKNHVHQILRKLEVHRRSQAADVLRSIWTERSMPDVHLVQVGRSAE